MVVRGKESFEGARAPKMSRWWSNEKVVTSSFRGNISLTIRQIFTICVGQTSFGLAWLG